jgi:hypothetical protein
VPIKSVYPPARPKTKPHLIEDISFSRDFIVCKCAWKGPVADYNRHRLDGNRVPRSRNR